MKERILKYAKYAGLVGYPLFYVACVAIFASLTFPYDRLRDRIVAGFNADQRASGGQSELQIDGMGGYWLSGVRMTGVTLLTAASEVGKPPTRLAIDRATVRYALLPLLVGGRDLGFAVDAFGGSTSGWYDVDGEDVSIDVTLDSVDIGQVGPLVQLLGVPIEGKLGGTIHLKLPKGKASKGSGTVQLEVQSVAVGDGKAKLKGQLALPRIELGPLTLSAEAKDGILKIQKLTAAGRDVDLQGDGRISLRELATDSLCDIQIRFRINDSYRAKNDVTKSLFGTPGSTAPALFELADPKIKQSKRADGFYGWQVRGPLGRLDFVPNGGGAAKLPFSP
jgi:type II secretion system protein N